MTQKYEPVRSVSRALQLMQVLQTLQKATLADLQRKTGLPKATLSRLLQTLEQAKAVWRAQGDGLWRPAFELRPTRILTPAHQRLIDAALPTLEDLRQTVVWPSDLAVRDGAHMRLLETTRRSSGLALNLDEIGHRIDMLRSAVGRAYIAYAPAAERTRIVRQIAKRDDVSPDVLSGRVESLRAEVLSRGYAERAPDFGGHDEPIQRFDDMLAAVALPVMVGEKVVACINLVWLKRFDARAAIVSRHLEHLQNAAREIAQRWSRSPGAG
jgi:IclR family mhp operon transcriptional activator